MQWIRTLAPALVAGCTAVMSLSALAQAEPAGRVRPKVDVRAMAPGPQASDAAAEPKPAASGLTRDQRKEATLQARQDDTLLPAGEASELRSEKAASAVAARTSTAAATPEPSPPAAPELAAQTASPTMVATVEPSTKKGARKKTRAVAASAPV